jgi:hypothetical protein
MRAVRRGWIGVLVAVATGCAGGDGGGADGTAAKRSITAEGQSRAEAALLRLSDFPDGWRASAPEDEDGGGHGEFRRCLATDYSDLTLTGQAVLAHREVLELTKVTSEAGVYASEDEARAAVEEFADGFGGDVEDCVSATISEALKGDDVEIGDVDVGELSFTAPSGVDDAGAWQIAVPVEVTSGDVEGLSLTFFLDLIYLRERELVAVLDTEEVGSPLDSELRDELLQAVARRMAG